MEQVTVRSPRFKFTGSLDQVRKFLDAIGGGDPVAIQVRRRPGRPPGSKNKKKRKYTKKSEFWKKTAAQSG